MKEIAGVVVLYNPTEKVLDNIKSYIDSVEHLYVVDNSEKKNLNLVSQINSINKVFYISNNGNKGIANALNIGAQKALENGFKWIMTMDQDSIATESMVEALVNFINSKKVNKIGIVSPFHLVKSVTIANEYEYELKDYVMTSGNLLNLEAYKVAGSFLEELFIDYVDIEYCLRLNKLNFKVVQVNNAILNHNLGDITTLEFAGKKILNTSNHSALRRYYITRNRFYVWNKYRRDFSKFCSKDKNDFIKEAVKILLVENHKLKKFKCMYYGYLDYKRNKFGKFSGEF